MTNKLINTINKDWETVLKADQVHHYFVYEPFEKYWSSSPKIIICNLEAYGYEEEGIVKLDETLLYDWMSNPASKTTRYTAAFVHTLLSALQGQVVSVDSLRSNYQELDTLKATMSSVCYMNFRTTSNEQAAANVTAIKKEVQNYKNLILNFWKACQPDIIIVSSVEGCKLFNLVANPDEPLKFRETITWNGILVCSIPHPSRPRYASYHSIIEKAQLAYPTLK